MNKTIFFLFLAVCVLGMALILLNQRLGREQETRPAARSGQPVVADAPMTGPAPEYTLPPQQPPKASSEAEQPAPSSLPQAIEREAASDREAAAAAAAALAVEQQEAKQALGASPKPPANPPAHVPATPPAAAPAQPRTAAPAPEAPARPGPAATRPAPERASQAAKKPASAEKAAGPQTITRFVVYARDSGATVRLAGNGPLRYKSMNLENPDRVVLDLEGRWEVKTPAVPKNPLVNAVRVGEMDGRTRIVIDLKSKPRSAKVTPAKAGDGVDVRVDK